MEEIQIEDALAKAPHQDSGSMKGDRTAPMLPNLRRARVFTPMETKPGAILIPFNRSLKRDSGLRLNLKAEG
jgi:hypothetical protein